MTREEAIKWLKIKRECYDYEGLSCEKPMDAGLKIGCGYCEEAIDMAIEALSERTGEWIWSDEDMSWKCGNCGCVFEEIDWKPEYNFCPNCGADMRGGK